MVWVDMDTAVFHTNVFICAPGGPQHAVCTIIVNYISSPFVSLQVTLGTVDGAILGMTQRKLKLDAAVMDGLTASNSAGTKGKGKVAETAVMGQLLQAMLTEGDKNAEQEA